MRFPEDLLYSREHEWVKFEGDIAIIGITDYAQDSLGDIVFFELPEPGTKVEAMNICGSVESVKSVSDIYCPVDGEVIEVNSEVLDKPELVNEDPYKNWLIKVKLSKPAESYRDILLSVEDYTKLVQSEKEH